MRSTWKLPLALVLGSLNALLSAGQVGTASRLPTPEPTTQGQRVRVAAQALASTYDPATGLFRGTGWWNSANGITALANAARALHTHEFDTIFATTFTTAPHRFPGFLNEFYDDEGWWALAWLDVYQLRGEPRYLAKAQAIFADMEGGWSESCGGGIWWKKNEHYKNAIANELFLLVATRLATLSAGTARADSMQWAGREERWFLHSGLLNAQSLVNDGLDATCHNNGRTTWSYNQGVLVAGLVGWNRLTGEGAALDTARAIGHAVALHLTDAQGVLHDPCEPECGEEGVQFKGVLVRDLVALEQAAPSTELAALLQANANSVWEHARSADDRFSVNWAGPAQDSGTGSLIAALDALTAPVMPQAAGTPR